jgi:hypothetical protein
MVRQNRSFQVAQGNVWSKWDEPRAVSHTDNRTFVITGGADTAGIGPECIEEAAITTGAHNGSASGRTVGSEQTRDQRRRYARQFDTLYQTEQYDFTNETFTVDSNFVGSFTLSDRVLQSDFFRSSSLSSQFPHRRMRRLRSASPRAILPPAARPASLSRQ